MFEAAVGLLAECDTPLTFLCRSTQLELSQLGLAPTSHSDSRVADGIVVWSESEDMSQSSRDEAREYFEDHLYVEVKSRCTNNCSVWPKPLSVTR